MIAVKYFLLLLVIGVVVTLSVLNLDNVSINYYNLQFEVQSIEIPLIVLVIISASTGFLIAWMLGLLGAIKSKAKLKKQEKDIQKGNSEIADLKVKSAIPKALIEQQNEYS
ncbi:MAG: LapA family protein [Nitrospinae bacterium]|nr:LapA family protein [Nitrospinota bacterium]